MSKKIQNIILLYSIFSAENLGVNCIFLERVTKPILIKGQIIENITLSRISICVSHISCSN